MAIESNQGMIEKLIQEIAAKKLGFETLAARNSDSDDFREVSVWGVREALELAFAAGRDHERKLQAARDAVKKGGR